MTRKLLDPNGQVIEIPQPCDISLPAYYGLWRAEWIARSVASGVALTRGREWRYVITDYRLDPGLASMCRYSVGHAPFPPLWLPLILEVFDGRENLVGHEEHMALRLINRGCDKVRELPPRSGMIIGDRLVFVLGGPDSLVVLDYPHLDLTIEHRDRHEWKLRIWGLTSYG